MKNKGFRGACLLCFFLVMYSCSKEEPSELVPEDESTEQLIPLSDTARVVGYLPYYRFDQVDAIAFCQLTHLNIAFANPNAAGALEVPANGASIGIQEVIAAAKAQNPELTILISLAGGTLTEEAAAAWNHAIENETERAVLIETIVTFVLEHNLDGVDVDLEWNDITASYSSFVLALNEALDEHTKLITAAYPSETRYPEVSDQALEALDFINIMAYDYRGPWDPTNVGPHSTLEHAQRGIDFWKRQGISPLKLTLGVPFYGYEFQPSGTVVAKTYASIVDQNPNNVDRDQVDRFYYNGRTTIRAKTHLAIEEVGGIMIWELGQDRFDQYSLLTTIHNAYATAGVVTSRSCSP